MSIARRLGQAITGTAQRIECAVFIVPFYLTSLAVFGTSQEEAVRGMVMKWIDCEEDLLRRWTRDKVSEAALRVMILSMGIVRAEQVEGAIQDLRKGMVGRLRHEGHVLDRLREHYYGTVAVKED